MHTPESRALFAAIVATPDDDAPRLVYADWLEEHGQAERAAFIRLQIEVAGLSKYDPHREVLTHVAGRLLDRHRDEWLAELPKLDGITWGAVHRGFVSSVVARSLRQFQKSAPDLWAAAPVDTLELRHDGSADRVARLRRFPNLRTLRVQRAPSAQWLDELLAAPILSSLHTLDLSGLELENGRMADLARCEALRLLRELILDDNHIGSGGLETLASARSLRSLTRLSLRGMNGDGYSEDPIIRSEGVQTLAASHVFQHLESLDLSGNEIDDEAVAYLVQSPHLLNLKELNLSRNDLTEAGLEVLTEEGWEVRLASLDLSGNPIGDEGAAHLAEAEALGELARLTLERCEIGPRGALALAGADWFSGLRALHLNDNSVGSRGPRALARAGNALGELRLRNNELGPDGAQTIADAEALAGLLVLDVSGNGIEVEGLRALGGSPHLGRLAVLDVGKSQLSADAGGVETAIGALAARAGQFVWLRLDGNPLGVPGVLAITRGHWGQLVELGLRGCGVNFPALAYLADHGRFPVLTRLALSGNQLSTNGLKILVGAPFVAELTHLDLSGNGLTNDGARVLAAAPLAGLRWLSVEYNSIENAGFTALARSTVLPRLETVRTSGNSSGDWCQLLRERFPGDEVWGVGYLGDDESIPF